MLALETFARAQSKNWTTPRLKSGSRCASFAPAYRLAGRENSSHAGPVAQDGASSEGSGIVAGGYR
jgi:hypothetical protein